MKNSLVKEKAFLFSLDMLKLYKTLIHHKDFILSKQVIRSATSIGANINEALAGLSTKDFTAKMAISSKEARETLYWLELLKQSRFIEYDYDPLIQQSKELVRMLTAIVKTAQNREKHN